MRAAGRAQRLQAPMLPLRLRHWPLLQLPPLPPSLQAPWQPQQLNPAGTTVQEKSEPLLLSSRLVASRVRYRQLPAAEKFTRT